MKIILPRLTEVNNCFTFQVQLLSPVCSEKGDSSLLDSSLPDISFPPGFAGGPVAGLRDPVDSRITLVRTNCIVNWYVCKILIY